MPEKTLNILNLPNILTIARILMVPFFIAALLYRYNQYALALFIVASLTDVLDGFVARMSNQKTRFGEVLDPIADKLLLMSSFVIFAILGWVPLWLTITVLSRDVIVIIGTVILYLSTGMLVMQVTRTGKLTIALQVAMLAYILIRVNYLGDAGSPMIFYFVVLISTAASGVQYIMKGLRFAGGH